MSKTTGAEASAGARRAHICARTAAWRAHRSPTVAGSSDRSVRYNVGADATVAEQAPLGAQILDITTALPAAGEHQHRLRQHLAPIMARRALTRRRHRRRQRRPHPQPISKQPQSVQPDVSNHSAPAAFYPHLTHTVTLHLGNASLSGIETRSYTRIIPRQRGFSADAHPHKRPPHEQSGLVSR